MSHLDLRGMLGKATCSSKEDRSSFSFVLVSSSNGLSRLASPVFVPNVPLFGSRD